MEFGNFNRQRFLFFTVCFIGCVYQLATVTFQYFEFRVRTEMTFEYPKLVVIPEIDIAVPIVNIINLTALYERHPKNMDDICHYINRDTNFTINSVADFNENCLTISQTTVLTNERLVETITVGDVQELTQDPSRMIRGVYYDDYADNLIHTNTCTIKKYFNGFTYS